MAALAMVYGGRGRPLPRLCLAAESDPSAAAMAWTALDTMPALTKRRILAAYAALSTRLVKRGAPTSSTLTTPVERKVP
jgi:hypothetical protein